MQDNKYFQLAYCYQNLAAAPSYHLSVVSDLVILIWLFLGFQIFCLHVDTHT